MAKGPIVQDIENTHRETAEGHEILDNSPVAIPLRFKRVDHITQKVQELVQNEFSRLAEKQGRETFEEADDFDVGDDYDPQSPYELDAEQEYYDHRNERRPPTEEGDADKGTGEDTDDIQSDGQKPKKDTDRDTPSKRRVSADGEVKKSKSVKAKERSVP